jgi:fermentation-respiration switch protein FrsA (DUF1100 family)
MKRKITFDRDGLTLVGNLFTPEGFDETGQYQAVIVQGSFTSVKEQMPQTYAEKFAAEGFVVLSFDYAHYGESEGSPRQFESPTEKTADLQAAVTYLLDLPYIDAVGMLGVCTSAGNAAYLAAADPRVKAIATTAGAFFEPAVFELMFGGAEGVAASRQRAADAQAKYAETGESTVILAYSETDPTALNYIPIEGAFDYYFNTARGNVPQYTNGFDVAALDQWLNFNPIAKATAVTTPAMVVHSDDSASPEVAKRFYEGLAGEKELVWGDGNHYDYYDSQAQIGFAVANVTRFFRTHLAA